MARLSFTHVSSMFLQSKNRIQLELTNNIKSLSSSMRYNYIYRLNIGLLEIKACDWECYFDLFRYCFKLRIERMQSLKGDIYKALSICIVHRFLLLQFFLFWRMKKETKLCANVETKPKGRTMKICVANTIRILIKKSFLKLVLF